MCIPKVLRSYRSSTARGCATIRALSRWDDSWDIGGNPEASVRKDCGDDMLWEVKLIN